MAKGNYQIPFDADGNQMHYPEDSYPRDAEGNYIRDGEGRAIRTPPVWRDNEPFDDVLVYEGYARGRSAAYFEFGREKGGTVTVFLKDFEEMVRRMEYGMIRGRFEFIKRGQNYGCKLVTP